MCVDNRKIKALVLGVGGNVSQGIIKALQYSNLSVKVYGACVGAFSKGLYMCDEAYICPYAADSGFLQWVVDFCNEHHIDIIFSGVEEVVLELARNEDVIKAATDAVWISSPYTQLSIGQDKYLTCKFLQESGCQYPDYCLWEDEKTVWDFAVNVGFPIIAKPRKGKGSKGIYVFRSQEDISRSQKPDDYVLEKCIGTENSEYTIGCYTDCRGKLQNMIIMQRRLFNGTTIWAKTMENLAIREECEKICNAFHPIGPLNIQMRVDEDATPVCFEINARFSGTTAMRAQFGFQDVKAMVLEYLFHEDIADCFHIQSGEAFRYEEELYLKEGTTDIMEREGIIDDVRSRLKSGKI